MPGQESVLDDWIHIIFSGYGSFFSSAYVSASESAAATMFAEFGSQVTDANKRFAMLSGGTNSSPVA